MKIALYLAGDPKIVRCCRLRIDWEIGEKPAIQVNVKASITDDLTYSLGFGGAAVIKKQGHIVSKFAVLVYLHVCAKPNIFYFLLHVQVNTIIYLNAQNKMNVYMMGK